MLPAPPAFDAADDFIIDITELPADNLLIAPSAAPIAPPLPQASRHYYSAAAQFGDLYEAELALSRKEVMWLNKFVSPAHAFMQIEAARTATVKLYLAVMHELEQRGQQAGAPLLKQVKALDEATREYAHTWQPGHRFVSRATAGHKVGAAVFLTIFQRCENAVRARYAYKPFDADVYFSESNDPSWLFNQYFGDAVQARLPGLAQAIPPPDAKFEQALNQADPTRWQPYFEQLRAHLPAQPAAFAAGVEALGEANCLNPTVAAIYHGAVRPLCELANEQPIREAVLRLYLHYLYYGGRKYNFKPKPLLKRQQKALFPLPEHLARFEALIQKLLRNKSLPTALAAVPNVYYKERRKIALDPAAVQAARHLHTGTVELLNEYLRDEASTPAAAPTPAPAPTKPTLEAAASPLTPAATFAAGLPLNEAHRALLRLFAARQLALPLAAVEAFAQQHGTLRHQLIDGLNDACHEVLDDVLVEEGDGEYTIYAPHYQRLIGEG